jgi:hypothetical protein
MGYYDNPDRILIGVDINTHIDLFEENWSDMTGGKEFDWNKDGDVFNEMSAEFDRIVENCIAKKLGHTAVEEFYDGNDYGVSVYTCTFWGDKNNSKDINVLEELQGMADDVWRDNGRVQLAIYGDDIFMSEIDSFLDKWGEKGTEYGVMADALTDCITIGVDFPEEFDSDPTYEKVNGMSIKNSKQIKSSVAPITKEDAILEAERDIVMVYDYFDRDGTINEYDIRLLENAIETLDEYNESQSRWYSIAKNLLLKNKIQSSRKITSAKSGEVDSIAADELALCTVNDGDLYRQMTTPVITNLKKKIKNGTYNKELALKAWLNLVTVEARKYVKEFGSRGDTIDKMFNLNTRKEAAKQVAEHYEDALNE